MTARRGQDGPDLFHHLREHDVPPMWDGNPITWGEWQDGSMSVFICPPPKPEPCPWCGSLAGTRCRVGETESPWRKARTRLYLTRCVGCSRDQVWDAWADQWWDLDEDDYGPDGSMPPTP